MTFLNESNDDPIRQGLGWAACFVGFSAIIAAVSVPIAWYHVESRHADLEMAKLGYVQVMDRPGGFGAAVSVWRKASD